MSALQLRRGLKANLPVRAAAGEPLIATDTRELYIGAGLLGTDPVVYKISDVIVSASQPDVATNAEKIWVNTTTNQLFRANVAGSAWVQCGTSLLTATDLGGATPVDTAAPSQKAVKTYVDNAISSLVIPTEWPDSVLTIVSDAPATPADGARYLVSNSPVNTFATHANALATYVNSTTGWVFKAPTTGTFLSVDDDVTGIYYFGGTTWVKKSFEVNTAGVGITITNGVIAINASTIVASDGSGGLTYNATTGTLAIGVIDGGTF